MVQSKQSKEAIEELRDQRDASAASIKKKKDLKELRGIVKKANEAARSNPLWKTPIEELRKLAEGHEIGTTHSGWKNPYPKSDPRSLLLEGQFVLFHDRERFKAALVHRQGGKDFTSEGEAVEDCFERKTSWMVAAPSERQSLDSLDQGKLWAKGFDMAIEDYTETREGNHSETLLKSAEILFANGSKIRAVPGRPDTVRGASANILITEFDFLEQPGDTWRAILPSITNPLRGGEKKCRLITTPNGKGGAMDKIWEKEDTEKTKWSRHLMTVYHSVLMGLPVDIEALQEIFDDPEGWRQEFECAFLDGSNVLLPYDLIGGCESFEASTSWNIADAIGGGPRYVGVDFGRQNDPTVIWTLQRVGEMLITREVRVLRGVSSPDQQRILSPIIKDATRTSFDYTGPGLGLGDYIVREHDEWDPKAHKFGKVDLCTFTAQFKREIFPRLRQAFERKELLIPVSREIREDLHEVKQITKGGDYFYNSPRTAKGHSDRCTALALAMRAADTGSGNTFKPTPFTRLANAFRGNSNRRVIG